MISVLMSIFRRKMKMAMLEKNLNFQFLIYVPMNESHQTFLETTGVSVTGGPPIYNFFYQIMHTQKCTDC